jgi:engulfment/cell motility protein 1
LDFIAPDDKTFDLWTDGINALLGISIFQPSPLPRLTLLNYSLYCTLLKIKQLNNSGKPMVSKEATDDMDILLHMEIKLRLLDIEGISIPQEPPPIPPPPPNFDFGTFSTSAVK